MLCLVAATLPAGRVWAQDDVSRAAARDMTATELQGFVKSFCCDCHDASSQVGGLNLEGVSIERLDRDAEVWERVFRRLRSRQMPPPDSSRPDESTYDRVVSELDRRLADHAVEHVQPGRTDSMRRLNRTEYRNAIRDLLGLEIDVDQLLPADASSHGFDNVTVADLSPTLLNRYILAAQKISRLALGRPSRSPGGESYRIPADRTQEWHVDGLPFGTRGGILVEHTFARDGAYDIQVRLTRDRNEHVEGMNEPHELLILVDRRPVARFTIEPPRVATDHQTLDADLRARIQVSAGIHQLGVTFLSKPFRVLETRRQPLAAHFNVHRHPRLSPAVYQVSVNGPFDDRGPGDTASRRRILISRPEPDADPQAEDACAREILANLIRRAYRRPIIARDLERPLEFFRQARDESDFESGLELAISSVLVNPQFLFRIEQDPPGLAAGTAYPVNQFELASRLSFFLWSSIPDETLLQLAERGELRDPEVLEAQTLRMLRDSRARNLVENFAAQWLYLRNLASVTPDLRLFPDFDDNLRQAMRRETELVFERLISQDRSVLDLLSTDETFLNERLAKHYGIPHIYGTHFRPVRVSADSHRGGLLRQASILTVTSYATRTSPVIRGHWILENLIGTPPPPPPANVPALKDNTVSSMLSVRERLAEHRKNPACAGCHQLMDPVGFSLENYDAVGRWREQDLGNPIDASGGLPDGSRFTGATGLESALLARPELFVSTMTEKMLTFALGRGIEHHDGPAVRRIVRDAKAADYRFSSLVLGIVRSTPFQMRLSR